VSRSYWEAICAGSGEACGHRHLARRQGEACARRLNHRLRVRSVLDGWYCLEVFWSVQSGAHELHRVLDQAAVS
jgi:hypothetical protein